MSDQTDQELLEWLSKDDEVRLSREIAPTLPGLEALPPSERQSILNWLGMTERADQTATEVEKALIDRLENNALHPGVIAWLLQARTILQSDALSACDKLGKLMANKPAENTLGALQVVGEAVMVGYKNLPIGLRLALPATALAAPFVGGAGAGIAAFGGAIGVPVLLVLFLGVSGITSVIASLLDTNDEGRIFVQSVLALIATDAAIMRLRQEARAVIAKEVVSPKRRPMPKDREAILTKLLALSPLDFERHVMGLFAEAGMTAWVTPGGSDAGIDGVAKDGERVILVQCKRYAPEHPVGRPAIQQFKGVIEENGADFGVFVTTSGYTAQARESAAKSDRVQLVDLEQLAFWHTSGLSLKL